VSLLQSSLHFFQSIELKLVTLTNVPNSLRIILERILH
jgi:hypothetical protein